MANVIKRVNNVTLKLKKWQMKKKLKSLATEFVQNRKLIKRAEKLKAEQPALKKKFYALQEELGKLEGETPSDDDGPSERYFSLLLDPCSA